MRTIAIAIACSALAVAAGLTAVGCGSSSGSGSTGATTATAPGRMGALDAATCTPPKIAGATVNALSVTGISCDQGAAHVLTVFKSNRVPGWACQQRISGRNVTTTCTQDGNAGNAFTTTWYVS